MKKIIFLMLFATATGFVAAAQSFISGNIKYHCTSINTVEVGYNDQNPYSGSVVIPAQVTYNSGTYSVTSLRNSAFDNCRGLTSITIPNSVTGIGLSAFWGCTGLTSVTIPNSVTSIGNYAFLNCSGLTSVTISNSLFDLSEATFYGCTRLTSVTIPNSVAVIRDFVFAECTLLTSVTIPSSVAGIGNSVFKNCSSLISVTIPNSVTSIGNYAFQNCRGLTSVAIANSVTSIGDNAFDLCSALTSVSIPNSVTRIGTSAFSRCHSLTSVTISNSVTSIGNATFTVCTNLTSVTIPNSVTSIGTDAFSGCTSLTSVTIPNSVTSIGTDAFSGCTSFTSVTIPNSVTSIGDNAFSRCPSLTSVTCNITSPLSINRNVFGYVNQSACRLVVPAGSFSAYQAAPVWKNFNPINGNVSLVAYTAIPDSNFEQALFDLGIDFVNGDHQVPTSDISWITELNINNKSIANLTGIRDFTSLQTLDCSNNQLTSLNVSGLTALTELRCSDNHLTSVNVSGLGSLQTLKCDYNQLTSLNVNGLTTLLYFDCSNNQLTSINVSELTDLGFFFCSYNQLTSLNVSELQYLGELNCSHNQLTNINLSGARSITYFDCSNNQLTSLNLDDFYSLGSFSCIDNPNLSCITYSDPLYAASNPDWHLDPTASYSTNCNSTTTPAPTSTPQTFCAGATVANLTATGTNLQWYDELTGGTALATGTILATGTYYVSQTIGGIESDRTASAVTIITTEPIPSNNYFIQPGISLQSVPGFDSNSHKIYATATSTTPLPGSTIFVTGTYYATNTQNGCESTRSLIGIVTYNLPSINSPACGSRLTSIASSITATAVPNATNYLFEVTLNGSRRTYYSSTNSFNLTQLPGTNAFDTTYSVRVAAGFNGDQYGDYGAACSVKTPALPALTKINTAQCGTTLARKWTTVYCGIVTGATAYRFEWKNGGSTLTYTTSTNSMQLGNYTDWALNTTYAVRVAIQFAGNWQAYGSACNVKTPATMARGISENETVSLTVKAVPNPFETEYVLMAQGGNQTPFQVSVYDMLGKQVEQFSVEANELENRSLGTNYSSGIYNVMISQGDDRQVVRIIKK